MSQASQYVRGAAAEVIAQSGIAVVTTATAWENPQISESVAVDKDKVASNTATITASVVVTVT